jgi:hypothetical protein
MTIKQIIQSQYQASLQMLRQSIEKCPESVWIAPEHRNKFWHISYHVLFYTHLYLQPTEEDFTPWAKHRDEHQFLGPLPWPPHKEPEIGEPYIRTEVLEYLKYCQQQVDEQVPSLDLEAESGFYWLPFNKLELQLYNIRHLQHHTGELGDRLNKEKVEIDWVGRYP